MPVVVSTSIVLAVVLWRRSPAEPTWEAKAEGVKVWGRRKINETAFLLPGHMYLDREYKCNYVAAMVFSHMWSCECGIIILHWSACTAVECEIWEMHIAKKKKKKKLSQKGVSVLFSNVHPPASSKTCWPYIGAFGGHISISTGQFSRVMKIHFAPTPRHCGKTWIKFPEAPPPPERRCTAEDTSNKDT